MRIKKYNPHKIKIQNKREENVNFAGRAYSVKEKMQNYVLLHTNNSLKYFLYLNAAYFTACLSRKTFSSM